jgi:hypothetical protein
VRSGHTVIFSPDGSKLEAPDGTRLPLHATKSGWELHLLPSGDVGEARPADADEFLCTPPDRPVRHGDVIMSPPESHASTNESNASRGPGSSL